MEVKFKEEKACCLPACNHKNYVKHHYLNSDIHLLPVIPNDNRPFMAKSGKSNSLGSFFGNVFSLFIAVVLIIIVVLKYYYKS